MGLWVSLLLRVHPKVVKALFGRVSWMVKETVDGQTQLLMIFR